MRSYRSLKKFIDGGVIIPYPDTVLIEEAVEIGRGSIINAFSMIKGRTKIGEDNDIGPFCVIENAEIGDGNRIIQSNLKDCKIGGGTTVGPFAYLRAGAEVGDSCRIGDFVEIKNSKLKKGVKAAHLAYIGDAEIGESTNVGCGTVFANFNGKIKQKTSVGANVFIGANVNLVAPLSVGDNSFIAAGSTITDNIPENSFAIARERQSVSHKDTDKACRNKGLSSLDL